MVFKISATYNGRVEDIKNINYNYRPETTWVLSELHGRVEAHITGTSMIGNAVKILFFI